jgi:hypothetical protein
MTEGSPDNSDGQLGTKTIASETSEAMHYFNFSLFFFLTIYHSFGGYPSTQHLQKHLSA